MANRDLVAIGTSAGGVEALSYSVPNYRPKLQRQFWSLSTFRAIPTPLWTSY